MGSPPHVRERPPLLQDSVRWGGITPACAGKTKRWSNTTRWARDHPRMCGKDHGMSSLCNHGLGSPPHVRERHRRRPYAVRRTRITPACAGKTSERGQEAQGERDHPRMCGKDSIGLKRVRMPLGSPPHVRERQQMLSTRTIWLRITPACAGKTYIVPNGII